MTTDDLNPDQRGLDNAIAKIAEIVSTRYVTAAEKRRALFDIRDAARDGFIKFGEDVQVAWREEQAERLLEEKLRGN